MSIPQGSAATDINGGTGTKRQTGPTGTGPRQAYPRNPLGSPSAPVLKYETRARTVNGLSAWSRRVQYFTWASVASVGIYMIFFNDYSEFNGSMGSASPSSSSPSPSSSSPSPSSSSLSSSLPSSLSGVDDREREVGKRRAVQSGTEHVFSAPQRWMRRNVAWIRGDTDSS